jgi:uncharacterized protein (DUF58 family)
VSSVSATAKTLRYHFSIRREGLFLYLILIAVLAAAFNTGNNLLFLFASVMASVSALQAVMNYLSREGNRVRRHLPSAVFAGEKFPVEFELTNNKRWFATHSVVIAEKAPFPGGTEGRVHFLRVPAGKTEYKTYRTQCNRRGLHQLERFRLECSYPFGFNHHSLESKAEQELLVYPLILPVRSMPRSTFSHAGELETPRKGFGFSLYGLREYQPGESSRFIHWRTSAKMDRLMVKEFEEEERQLVTVVFDNSTTREIEDYDERFEQRVSEAASLAAYFLRRGWQVGLVSLSGSVGPGGGDSQLKRILHLLALIKQVREYPERADKQLLAQLEPESGHRVWVGDGSALGRPLQSTGKEAVPGR